MQEHKRVLWGVRIFICLMILAAGLTLRFAIGGKSYQISKSWYTQQMQNSVLPNVSLQNIQKKCKDFLSSGSSIVMPSFDGKSLTTESKSKNKSSSLSEKSSSAAGSHKS